MTTMIMPAMIMTTALSTMRVMAVTLAEMGRTTTAMMMSMMIRTRMVTTPVDDMDDDDGGDDDDDGGGRPAAHWHSSPLA